MFSVISTGKDESKFGAKGEIRLLHDNRIAQAIRLGMIENKVEYAGDGRRVDETKSTLKIVESIVKEKKLEESPK